MTTADAKVELVADILFTRSFNVSRDTARQLARSVITALEASPNSRTEAVTDEMIEAGVAAFNHTETLSVRRLLEVAYPAMRAAELQAARPIDQPMLTADEEDELVERINANPNLRPIDQQEAVAIVRRKAAPLSFDETPEPGPIAPVQDDNA